MKISICNLTFTAYKFIISISRIQSRHCVTAGFQKIRVRITSGDNGLCIISLFAHCGLITSRIAFSTECVILQAIKSLSLRLFRMQSLSLALWSSCSASESSVSIGCVLVTLFTTWCLTLTFKINIAVHLVIPMHQNL